MPADIVEEYDKRNGR
ncbi:hypothetical protein [Saccharopolyspora soli]